MRSNMKRVLVFTLCAIMLVFSGSCGLRTVEESDVSNPSDASDVSLPPVPIPETPVVLLMDNAYYGGVDEYIPMELGNYEIAYIEEECVDTTHTVTVFGIEFVGNYYATKKLLNTKTELRWYDNVGVKDREYSFNFQIEKETGKLISLTFSATPHPREHNLLHEKLPLEEIIRRCQDFLIEQTGVEGWVENERYRDEPNEYGGIIQFRKYVNNVCDSWANFLQVDECGNIWKFNFTGIWDYEGIQIPDWPDSFFPQIAQQKLNVCFADLESVAEVKDVSIDDGPELCYIRERESWALEFYVNFTVVESDGMQKDHYTKMCVLFDS